MKKSLLLAMFLSWSTIILQAQTVMLLKNHASRSEYQFLEGERLRLKLKNSAHILKGSWQYGSEDTVIIATQLVALKDIQWIDVSTKEKGIWLLRKGQDVLILAGLGYLAVSQVNSLIDTERFETDNKVLLSSVNMVAAGLVCRGLDRLIRKRKVQVYNKKFGIYLL